MNRYSRSFPRPIPEDAWRICLRVPMPSWVWSALELATARLNELVLTDFDGRTNIGYDAYLSVGEYVQDIALMACWDVNPDVMALSVSLPKDHAVWPVERGWSEHLIYLDRHAYSSMRSWVGARNDRDLVGFVQWAVRQKGALELPREENDLEPILRLQGSKNQIAPWVVQHFPKHRLFVDVHGGTGSILGAKNPSHLEIFNDAHQGIVNLWRVLRERSDDLVRALLATPYSRVEWESAKEADCPNDPVEWARRVMVASWMGYGGDWQRPSSGFRSGAALLKSRTTPTHDWQVVVGRVQGWVDRMRGVALENLGDLAIIERYDCEDALFYCDPPYHDTKHRNNYKHRYTEKDHRALADKLHAIKGKAIISGYESKLYRELFADWTCVRKAVRANRGAERTECLWLCPKTAKEYAGRLV